MKLSQLITAGALAVTAATGCEPTAEKCVFANPNQETATTLEEAKDLCERNRTSIITCITTSRDDIATVDAACIDQATRDETLEFADEQGDVRMACQVNADVSCAEATKDGVNVTR